MPTWRVAKSLEVLRDQVNKLYPNRSKSSDGTIGDEAHQATVSDHNPNANGVVTALDLTHDPAHGFDSYAFAETLRLSRDPRIKYIISNSRIFSKIISPWVWRKYTGTNPHDEHVHISVGDNYDDVTPWKLDSVGPIPNREMDIIATEFGGSNDRQFSAYTGELITDATMGVALPFKFVGERPKVRVIRGNLSAIGDIVDVGPWNTNDPYWQTNSRPQAESGTDKQGRKTNKAGIDLTPAMAKILKLDGKNLVDWEFVSDVHDVRWMQTQLGVEADGIIGPLTTQAMIKYIEDNKK